MLKCLQWQSMKTQLQWLMIYLFGINTDFGYRSPFDPVPCDCFRLIAVVVVIEKQWRREGIWLCYIRT